jgi:hypothetical protein
MLRAMIVESRPLHAEDYNPPSKKSLSDPTNPKGYDVADLVARVDGVRATLATLVTTIGGLAVDAQIKQSDGSLKAVTTLRDAVVELDKANVQFVDAQFVFGNTPALQLQQLLIDAANHGLAYAFPSAVTPSTDALKAPLLEQARSVLHRLGTAVDRATALTTGIAADATIENVVTAYIAAGKLLLGESFAIIPLFTYNNEADILQSHSDEAQLLDHATNQLGMVFPADEWLENSAHVRPKLARWDYVRALHETLNASTLALHPVQLPFRARDSWVAVEFPELYKTVDEKGDPVDVPFTIQHDTLSVTVHGVDAFAAGAKHGGLLIDDWTEVIPTRDETTGLSFNYNQPNAMPPQALLLAVTPKITGHWDWQALVGVLEDTLLRAKLRAVEPALLDKQGKAELSVLLPAILSSFSEYDLDIALDYRITVADVYKNAPVKTAFDHLNV